MDMRQVQQASDKALDDVNERIAKIYDAALKKAVTQNKRAFTYLQKYRQERDRRLENGEDTAHVEALIRTQMNRVIRQQDVVDKLVRTFEKAGRKIAPEIRRSMGEVYQINANGVFAEINDQAGRLGLKMTFSMIRKDQAAMLVDMNEGFMSKIAYANLGSRDRLMREFQNEMAQAVLLGEGQDKVVRRLRRCGVQEASRARRIAQTEHTRVQSQARYQAGQTAAESGVRVYNEWSANRDDRVRDTHADLNGQKVMQGDFFTLSDGDRLRFPGDPMGQACNVINCRCVLVPRVLLSNERLTEDGEVVRE